MADNLNRTPYSHKITEEDHPDKRITKLLHTLEKTDSAAAFVAEDNDKNIQFYFLHEFGKDDGLINLVIDSFKALLQVGYLTTKQVEALSIITEDAITAYFEKKDIDPLDVNMDSLETISSKLPRKDADALNVQFQDLLDTLQTENKSGFVAFNYDDGSSIVIGTSPAMLANQYSTILNDMLANAKVDPRCLKLLCHELDKLLDELKEDDD